MSDEWKMKLVEEINDLKGQRRMLNDKVKWLRQLLTNFIEINQSKPEVKWIALDDLAKVVKSELSL